jgi:hypothetical protein
MTIEEIAQAIIDSSLDNPARLPLDAARAACDALGFDYYLWDKHPTVVDVGPDEPLCGGEVGQ